MAGYKNVDSEEGQPYQIVDRQLQPRRDSDPVDNFSFDPPILRSYNATASPP